jgi:hypothetical protein
MAELRATVDVSLGPVVWFGMLMEGLSRGSDELEKIASSELERRGITVTIDEDVLFSIVKQ